jgi:hypothetical protein
MATLNEEIEKLATLYKKLMTEDNTPDEEAQAKMEFLEIISNIEAMIGEKDDDLNQQIDEVKDKLLSWDPYGPWFKEQRELVKEIYNLITNVKKFKFSGEASDSMGTDGVPDVKKLKNEIQDLRSEVNSKINLINEDLKNIKKSITLIVKSIQNGKKNNQNKQEEKSKEPESRIPKPVPISSPIKGERQRITKVPTVRPIGGGDIKKIKPRGEFKSIPIPIEDEQANKPIPVQIPSTQKPAPIEPIQAPINLDNDSLEVEIDPKQLDLSIEPVEEEPNLGNILSNKKETKPSPRYDKDRLFNILSGQEASEAKPTSSQSSQDSLFEVVSPMNNQNISNGFSSNSIFLGSSFIGCISVSSSICNSMTSSSSLSSE